MVHISPLLDNICARQEISLLPSTPYKIKIMIKTLLKSGFGTAVGNAASMPFNLLSMAVQGDMNKDLMDHQQKLNLQSFQHQVASTSIGAQVKRLKALGLNPALALGSGVGSMSGQVGGTSLSGVSPSSPYVMSPSEVSQIENIDANTDKTNEETIRLKTENLYHEDMVIADLNNKKADFLVKLSQKDLNESAKSHLEKSIQELDARIAESQDRRNKIAQEIDESKARTDLLKKQAKREQTKIDFEDYYKQKSGSPSPMELYTTPAGSANRAGRTIKTAVGKAVEVVKDKFKKDDTSSTSAPSNREISLRNQKLRNLEETIARLKSQYENHEISKSWYDRGMEICKEKAKKLGVYEKYF